MLDNNQMAEDEISAIVVVLCNSCSLRSGKFVVRLPTLCIQIIILRNYSFILL